MKTARFKFPGVPVTAGEPGYNEFGVPLSRCCGMEHDAHYWDWLRYMRLSGRVNELFTQIG